jgi:hypothetical protein
MIPNYSERVHAFVPSQVLRLPEGFGQAKLTAVINNIVGVRDKGI